MISIVYMGASSPVPTVDLRDISIMDDGRGVVVHGMLVNLRRYDSGSEALVLASPDGQATIRVQVAVGMKAQPSAYARPGDTLKVFGRLSTSGSDPVMYCSGDSVSVESRSEQTLTVASLSHAWQLLLDDELRIRGVIVAPLGSECPRLFDRDFFSSILLRGASRPLGDALGEEAIVIGLLRLERPTMTLILEVLELLPIE